jgi:hypothetical protein
VTARPSPALLRAAVAAGLPQATARAMSCREVSLWLAERPRAARVSEDRPASMDEIAAELRRLSEGR